LVITGNDVHGLVVKSTKLVYKRMEDFIHEYIIEDTNLFSLTL